MGLILHTEMVTDAQLEWLQEHEYYGNLDLTKQAATQLIEEFIEQDRIGLSKDYRLFIDRLNDYDPQYLINYQQFKRSLL